MSGTIRGVGLIFMLYRRGFSYSWGCWPVNGERAFWIAAFALCVLIVVLIAFV